MEHFAQALAEGQFTANYGSFSTECQSGDPGLTTVVFSAVAEPSLSCDVTAG